MKKRTFIKGSATASIMALFGIGLSAPIPTKAIVAPISEGGSFIPCKQRIVDIIPVCLWVSGQNNQYLHTVGIIEYGNVDKIAQVGGVDQIFLDGQVCAGFNKDTVAYKFYSGAPPQVIQGGLCPGWQELNQHLRGVSHVYVKIKYDPIKFEKVPKITLVV